MKKLCITAFVLCVLLCVFVGCGIAPAPNGSVETTEAPETSNQHIGETTASPEASRPDGGEITAPPSTSTPTDGEVDKPSDPSSPNDEDWLLSLEYLDPAIFGAVGDGKTDDIYALELAAHVASKMGKILKLPQKEYYTSRPLSLNNVAVISENAKISFYGMQASVPAVDMQTNVTIRGKLRIWTVDNTNVTKNHGGRCAMGFGDYSTGVGARNCYVEELEVSGGYYNANGILITGDSSNIEIEKINIIGADTIGRGVLIHWGNAKDHYPEYVDGKWTGIISISPTVITPHTRTISSSER